MCRIPPVTGEKFHLVGEVNPNGTVDEPSRAFWTNKSVKALMRQNGPQPEFISLCGKVRGDWRSVQVSERPFYGKLCGSCRRQSGRDET